MKFLIAGFGSIGRRHFRNLLELGENDLLFLRSHKSTLEDSELDGFRVETKIEDALAQQPDAVIIATPSALHLDLAIPAAEQGCHLLIEKPLSSSLERVDEIKQIVARSGSRVLIGFQFRYHPNLLAIKGLLEEGRIGKPLFVRSHWGEYLPNWHPWEDYRQSYAARKDLGGGVLRTLCHPFDYLDWLFGEGKVQSALLGYSGGLGIDVEDTAEIGLVYPENLIGTIHLNYTQRPPQHTLEIVGSNGLVRWDNQQSQLEVYHGQTGSEMVHETISCPPGFERNDLFLAEMKHFLEVLQNQIEPVCSLDDGARVLSSVIEAEKLGNEINSQAVESI